ncbi:hypothetical protein FHR81_004515 [Actinoalloteichus hoggarensis]|uniref:Uncharacterized protein n=1 Tax=Actinoalloteichus hoggarensis TaxID=1470176 RepID=A0A221W3K4_9PSEU|nr:hypothetical protein [Actinoalloteichus hoggarensis]ASO20405.1 hypothetical protein AHOG_13810 [Actinoalloteichus hoggarensis]MBB5923444.1 hypothetical protein [Actinoalloteichus hoggarensis]
MVADRWSSLMWPLLSALLVTGLTLFGLVVVGALLVDRWRHGGRKSSDGVLLANGRRVATMVRGGARPEAARADGIRESPGSPPPKSEANRST